jgi:hypothetical protein
MCSAGFAHTGLTHGLSRMTGNCHVRFLGEGAAAMPLPYPTAEVGSGERVAVAAREETSSRKREAWDS